MTKNPAATLSNYVYVEEESMSCNVLTAPKEAATAVLSVYHNGATIVEPVIASIG